MPKVIIKYLFEGKRKQKTFRPEKGKELLEMLMEFNLGEDGEELMDALNGWRWHGLARDLDEQMRLSIKHADKEHLQEARDLLHGLLNERGLLLWD